MVAHDDSVKGLTAAVPDSSVLISDNLDHETSLQSVEITAAKAKAPIETMLRGTESAESTGYLQARGYFHAK